MSSAAFILFLLASPLPAAWSQQQTTPSPLTQLSALETSMQVAWRNKDRTDFQAAANAALAKQIPRTVLSITSSVFGALSSIFALFPATLLVLSPVFSILSVVTEILGLTLFPEENPFAEMYDYLQDQFATVNGLLEGNFHAIKDVQSILLCDSTTSNVKLHQTAVRAFFSRYLNALQQARTDRSRALTIFDLEIPQYRSAAVLLELKQMLTKKQFYTDLIAYCAKGNYPQYLSMAIELHYTFAQAIILDSTVKMRLFNLTKETLDYDRQYWRNQSVAVVNLMVEAGNELVMSSWYGFYKYDADRTLSDTASSSRAEAASRLSSDLASRYPYVRTAVTVVPFDSRSISVTDAFGASMQTVGPDSFVCYRSQRASRETVIVLCRNVFVYPNEQAQLDSAYTDYSRGVLSVSLVDALNSNRWDDISTMMKNNHVSFFAVRVVVYLKSGSVSYAQSSGAFNLVFFQSEGTAFQALVVAKLVSGSSSAVGKVVPPTKVVTTSGASSLAVARWWTMWVAIALQRLL